MLLIVNLEYLRLVNSYKYSATKHVKHNYLPFFCKLNNF